MHTIRSSGATLTHIHFGSAQFGDATEDLDSYPLLGFLTARRRPS